MSSLEISTIIEIMVTLIKSASSVWRYAQIVLTTVALVVCIVAPLQAGLYGPTSIRRLTDRATDIIVANVEHSGDGGDHAVEILLRVERVVKGNALPGSTMQVYLPPSSLMSQTSAADWRWPRTLHGLWFIYQQPGGRPLVLPTAYGDYDFNDAYFPAAPKLVELSAKIPASPLGRTLLEILQGYLSTVSDPSLYDRRVLSALWEGESTVIVPLLKYVIDGTQPAEHQAIGIAALLRFSSPDGLSVLIDNMQLIMRTNNFHFVTGAIENYLRSDSPNIAPLLRVLGETYGSNASISRCIAKSWYRTGTKQALPGIAMLMDNQDSETRVTAARAMARFALLGTRDGNIGHARGPWADEKSFPTGVDTMLATDNTDQYVSHWRAWWIEHKAALGF